MLDALRHLKPAALHRHALQHGPLLSGPAAAGDKIPFISILESTAKACAAAQEDRLHPGHHRNLAPGFMKALSQKGRLSASGRPPSGRFSWMGSIGSKRGSG